MTTWETCSWTKRKFFLCGHCGQWSNREKEALDSFRCNVEFYGWHARRNAFEILETTHPNASTSPTTYNNNSTVAQASIFLYVLLLLLPLLECWPTRWLFRDSNQSNPCVFQSTKARTLGAFDPNVAYHDGAYTEYSVQRCAVSRPTKWHSLSRRSGAFFVVLDALKD